MGEKEKIGIGAGAGAIIGAILGGVKGALAGILIGGGGTIAATEGKDVELPAGRAARAAGLAARRCTLTTSFRVSCRHADTWFLLAGTIASLPFHIAAPARRCRGRAPTATAACTEWVALGGGPARSLIYRTYSLDARNDEHPPRAHHGSRHQPQRRPLLHDRDDRGVSRPARSTTRS